MDDAQPDRTGEVRAWLRRVISFKGKARSSTTINNLAAVGSFYQYQDGLGLRQTSAGRGGSEQKVHTSRSCTT